MGLTFLETIAVEAQISPIWASEDNSNVKRVVALFHVDSERSRVQNASQVVEVPEGVNGPEAAERTMISCCCPRRNTTVVCDTNPLEPLRFVLLCHQPRVIRASTEF